MKKFGLKSIGILLAILIVFGSFSAFSFSVSAAGAITAFCVGPADAEDSSAIGAINWFYSSKDGSYYVFAPETYDKSALKVWFTASEAVACDGAAINSGDVTDAFADGAATLSCGSVSYSVKLLDGGDVASVSINTESGSLDYVHADKENKEPGTIEVADYDGTVQYSGALEYIKGRGNSTWNSAKKPYNIKLAKKADLFGMGKSKKWCLLANAGDATLMRNLLAYKFAKTIGVDVTSDVIPVNLYINKNYMGAYILTEKVEIGENRVDINNLESNTEKVNEADLDTYPLAGDQNSQAANTYQYVDIPNNPDEITGGYLLELEKIYRYPPEASGFITKRQQAVVMKEPEYASKEQVEYMRAYYQDFEDAVYSQSGYNDKGVYYTEYIDSESIARMYLAEEFGANFDGCSSSFFLYKDVDGKITAGPAWDFDLSFAQHTGINGLINTTCSTDKPNSLYIQNCFINYDNMSYNSFLAQLFSHNDFQEVVQNVWNNVVTRMFDAYYADIDVIANRLHSTVVMNAIRWNTYGTTNADSILSNYNSRLNVVKNYISQRYPFLSKAYRDDTYFVKYDIGAYGTTLIHDTIIYNAGGTFTVHSLPQSDKDHCCTAWYLNSDHSGSPAVPGRKLTVTGNTKLYAKWYDHEWSQSAENADWDCCEICGRYRDHATGELLEGWYGNRNFENGTMYRHGYKINGYYYDFGDDGLYTGVKANGLLPLGEGGFVYCEDGVAQAAGLVEENGAYYYFGLDTFALSDGSYSLSTDKMNGLLPGGTYIFENYRIKFKNGVYIEDGKAYYYINNKKQKGAYQVGDDIYYFGANYYALADGRYYISADLLNGLLPAGNYNIKDYKIVILNGLVEENGKYYYYINNVKQVGAYQVGEDIYYFGASTKTFLADGTYSISADLIHGLLPAGTYAIKDGKILKEGLFVKSGKTYYYENYVKKMGMVPIGAEIYYFGTSYYTIDDGYYYIAGNMTNGVLPAGSYRINSGVIQKDGFVVDGANTYYYKDYVRQVGAIKIGDDIYYFSPNTLSTLSDGYYYIAPDMTNGLLPAGSYQITDGVILKTGFVVNDSKTYYYKDYVKQVGAVPIGDEIYYFGANTSAFLDDGNYYVSAVLTNGVLPAGKYHMKDGKIILKNGIVEENGALYYYENDMKVAKGLVLVDGKYYFFNRNYKALKTGTYTLPEDMMNGLLPAGRYKFVNYQMVV